MKQTTAAALDSAVCSHSMYNVQTINRKWYICLWPIK